MFILRTTRPKQKRSGLVYLLRGKDTYKIGITTRLPERLTQLVPQCPYRLDCAHIIKTDDMIGVESYWHLQFKAKRLNGEWFALEEADIKRFMQHQFATIDVCGRYVALDQTTLTELLQKQTEQQPNRTGQKRTMAIDFSKHMGSSGYLKAADIDATDEEEMIVTITGAEEVYSESLQKEQIEVSFEETEKKLTLNVTNTKKLVEMFGSDDEEWHGKRIKLYSDDSKTPQGAPCRTIKIKPVKKKVDAEPARELTTAGGGRGERQAVAAGSSAARSKAKNEDYDPAGDPFRDE